MRAKLLSVIGAVLGTAFTVFGAGATPISNLKLVGDANGNGANFTNITTIISSNVVTTTVISSNVSAGTITFVSGTTTSTMTQADVASMQGTAPTNQLKELYSASPTNGSPNSAVITKGFLGNTTLGSEGIQAVGAFGGYSLAEMFEDTYFRGPSRDLPSWAWTSTNLTVSYSQGDVYEPIMGYFHLAPGNHTLPDNSTSYAYWSTNDTVLIQWTTGTRPNAEGNIYLATFVTAFGRIIHVGTAIAVGDELLSEDVAFANIMPSIITDGLNVFASGTNLTNIVLNGGTEWHNMADRIVHPTFDFASSNKLVMYGHTNSIWASVTTNLFPFKWDNGTNIVSCDSAKWYRGVFVDIAGSGQLNWVLPHQEFTNYTDAAAADDPDRPNGFDPYIPLCTAYVFSGSDTVIRADSTYWLDRRFMIRRGTLSTGGGSSGGTTPTLQQVLIAGPGTGGILPTGMGDPTTDDQAASKHYVDSTKNKASTGTAYVDPVNGDDITGRIEKGSQPFKTIQAAINACVAAPATDSRRFLVTVSIGTYSENVTMANYVSLRGMDIESTIIRGQVYYPPTYTDLTGGELQVLTIYTTNQPAININMGADGAYSGTRSCATYATWTNNATVKPTIQISRGLFEVYATTWVENDNLSLNGVASKACLYYGTTNAANMGTYRLIDSSGSHTIRCTDTNDTVSICYSDAATDSRLEMIACHTEVYLDDSTNHVNKIKLGYMDGGNGSVDLKGCLPTIYLSATNSCDLILGMCQNTPSARLGGGVHYTTGRVRAPNTVSGHAYVGGASTANDYVESFFGALAPQTSVYPVVYTNEGSAGTVSYLIGHGRGDLLMGGSIDMSSAVSTTVTPLPGHVRIYVDSTSGFERPYFIDSRGNKVRIGRDSVWTIYNTEATTLNPGEAIYLVPGLYAGTTMYGKRAIATNVNTCAFAIVTAVGGIAPGDRGIVNRLGRLENGVDTSFCAQNSKLYLSATTPGAFTNVPPVGPYISQELGRNQISAVNGSIEIGIMPPDALGGQPSTYYASQSQMDSTTGRVYVLENSTSLWNQASVDGVSSTGRLVTLEGRTSTWNQASSDGISATGRLVVIEGRTSTWNQASVDGVSATGRLVVIEGRTSTWNQASSDVGVLQGSTSLWNKASSDGVSSTGRLVVIEGRTSTWNQASIDATSSTGRLVTLEGRTSTWNQAASDVGVLKGSTSLWNQASTDATSSTGRLVVIEGRTSTWNQASSDGISATGRLVVIEGRTSTWNQASSDGISATGRLVVIEGRTSTWNKASTDAISATGGVSVLNNSTSSWNQIAANGITNRQTNVVLTGTFSGNGTGLTGVTAVVVTPIRFRADIGNANITYANTLTVTPFTNVSLAASGGSIYSNGTSVCQWWPKATNGVVKLQGSWNAASANSATYKVSIYKNGALMTDVYSWLNVINLGNNSMGSTWNFTDEHTPTVNDYYQVYTTFNANRASVGTGSNNWWYGEVTP